MQTLTPVQDLTTNLAAHDLTGLVDSVHFWMTKLELTNHVACPGCHGTDNEEDDYARDHAEGVERRWDTKDTETDLGLHHQNDSADPADLHLCQYSRSIASTVATHILVVWAIFREFTEDLEYRSVHASIAMLVVVRSYSIDFSGWLGQILHVTIACCGDLVKVLTIDFLLVPVHVGAGGIV